MNYAAEPSRLRNKRKVPALAESKCSSSCKKWYLIKLKEKNNVVFLSLSLVQDGCTILIEESPG